MEVVRRSGIKRADPKGLAVERLVSRKYTLRGGREKTLRVWPWGGLFLASKPLGSEEVRMLNKLFNRENLLVLGLCLLVILLLIVTTDSAPQWIYQGF